MLSTEDLDNETADAKARRRFLLRYYRVFNLEQCELRQAVLDKIPTVETHEHDPIEAAERIIAAMPNPPEIQHAGSKAFYSPIVDRITLPPRELFASAEEYYATALHEICTLASVLIGPLKGAKLTLRTKRPAGCLQKRCRLILTRQRSKRLTVRECSRMISSGGSRTVLQVAALDDDHAALAIELANDIDRKHEFIDYPLADDYELSRGLLYHVARASVMEHIRVEPFTAGAACVSQQILESRFRLAAILGHQ